MSLAPYIEAQSERISRLKTLMNEAAALTDRLSEEAETWPEERNRYGREATGMYTLIAFTTIREGVTKAQGMLAYLDQLHSAYLEVKKDERSPDGSAAQAGNPGNADGKGGS